MMKKRPGPKFFSPFPSFHLSPDEEGRLRELGPTLVQNAVEEYNQFVESGDNALDPEHWRFIRQDENLQVHKRRAKCNLDSLAVRRAEEEAIKSGQEITTAAIVDLRCLGTTAGNLDDAMYGVISDTTDVMRIKSAYGEDGITDCAVMSSIIEPSEEDPFHCMHIKWRINVNPLPARILARRDFVYLEYCGFATLTNGERVGFQLLHSIDFPQAPALDWAVRSNMAVCGLYRQKRENTLEVYASGIFVAGQNIRHFLPYGAAYAVAMTLSGQVHVAHMKKLSYLLQQRLASGEMPNLSETEATQCRMCKKKRKRAGTKGSCRMCHYPLCGSCRVVKKLYFLTPDKALEQRSVTLCTACITFALNADAASIAREEMSMSRGSSTLPYLQDIGNERSNSRSGTATLSRSIP